MAAGAHAGTVLRVGAGGDVVAGVGFDVAAEHLDRTIGGGVDVGGMVGRKGEELVDRDARVDDGGRRGQHVDGRGVEVVAVGADQPTAPTDQSIAGNLVSRSG